MEASRLERIRKAAYGIGYKEAVLGNPRVPHKNVDLQSFLTKKFPFYDKGPLLTKSEESKTLSKVIKSFSNGFTDALIDQEKGQLFGK